MISPLTTVPGEKVNYFGGHYMLIEYTTLPHLCGSMPFARLKDYSNPVPCCDLTPVKQPKRNYDL